MAYLADVEDLKRPAARVVCRELLAACVLRPLLMWATPYYCNKALYAFLGAPQVGGVGVGGALGSDALGGNQRGNAARCGMA